MIIEKSCEESFAKVKREVPEFLESINSFQPETKEFIYQVFRAGFMSGIKKNINDLIKEKEVKKDEKGRIS